MVDSIVHTIYINHYAKNIFLKPSPPIQGNTQHNNHRLVLHSCMTRFGLKEIQRVFLLYLGSKLNHLRVKNTFPRFQPKNNDFEHVRHPHVFFFIALLLHDFFSVLPNRGECGEEINSTARRSQNNRLQSIHSITMTDFITTRHNARESCSTRTCLTYR